MVTRYTCFIAIQESCPQGITHTSNTAMFYDE